MVKARELKPSSCGGNEALCCEIVQGVVYAAPLAEKIVVYLNELLKADEEAIGRLVEYRVPTNEALANHQTCQCVEKNGVDYVGLLGILNGLCGVKPNGYGYLAAEFCINENTGKKELVGFRYTP